MRKFEKVKRLENEAIRLPERSTKHSAGYDFFAIEDAIIPSSIITKVNALGVMGDKDILTYFDKPTYVKTGVKAKMENDEVLLLFNRSSNPSKKNLIIPNSVGVIDADYYGNLDNDGEMCFAFYNVGNEPVVIKKGEKLGQGIFTKFLTTDDDQADGERAGGFGSTGN